MNIKGMTREALANYVAAQLSHFFPDGQADLQALVERDLDEALDRVSVCINAVRMWKPEEFDYLHSSQYCTFIYYLSNTAWKNRQDERFCTKLFLLNKALNGFDCFYNNELPEKFLIGHSVGIVLVRMAYPNYLVLYQNCTIGRTQRHTPTIGEGTILYPNSAIVGKCDIGPRTILSQGCSVINADTPGNCYVFERENGLVFTSPKRDVLADYFRL